MTKLFYFLSLQFVLASLSIAQTDTMYIMKNGEVLQKFNVSEIDSIIFYKPSTETPSKYGIMYDMELNAYKTVTIGKQTWMAENLKSTILSDGEAIPMVEAYWDWYDLTIPAFCYYANDSSYGKTYGVLYNWYAVETGTLCPLGWRIPEKSDYDELVGYLGGYTFAGGKLKDVSRLWVDPNTGATNESGFTALPAGNRHFVNSFSSLGLSASFWLGDSSINNADYFSLLWNRNSSIVSNTPKKHGLSVRCIQIKVQ